ncbi:MAG TPA: helix-turn-helix transcriptional regulator [Candidatus Limnocylindria bacterium]|jgi:transcriptional regulator with XRE-family HTH domain|nr:helix-turn-helix transcriptional regulator [Candidatus Limnocylindria bacterium]
MTDFANSVDGRSKRFATFLIRHRERIPPATLALGTVLRARGHYGQPVMPDEIARAIGVSARWYELAEAGVPTRPSLRMVDRLGSVFDLDVSERETLWDLALPSLERDGPRADSLLVLDAHASLRWYLRKLGTASSADEILNLAEQTACAQCPETSFIIAMSRTPEGAWVAHGEGCGTRGALRRMWRQYDEIHRPLERMDRAGLDLLMGYPTVSEPGELMTFASHDRETLARILKGAERRYERNNGGELLARIRSRSGYVGHLFLADFNACYGAADRALIATIADLASLALR